MTRAALPWGPSSQATCLATAVVVGAALAVATRRVEALALVAPSLWALLVRDRGDEPATVAVDAPDRVEGAEGELLPVAVRVEVGPAVPLLTADVALPDAVRGGLRGAASGRRLQVAGELRASRWGRHRLGPVRVRALGPLGLRSAVVDVVCRTEAAVAPRPWEVRRSSAPGQLPDRPGDHVARTAGAGVEPLGVRPWSAGDEARRIDWRATARRGELHVAVSAAERSVDLVLVVDALSDVGRPPATSLDRSVRAAAGLAERWLRDRDRVGLVVLGGGLTWLTPAGGRVQHLRVAAAVLQAGVPPGDVPPDLRRLPRQVVPAGSVVVVLSPLLDPRSLDAVVGLRSRRVVVLDVLDAEPAVAADDGLGQLALRLWRLDRTATLDRLRSSGVAVLRCDPAGEAELDVLLARQLRALR